MTCKGICVRYKYKKKYHESRYDDEHKRCKTCEIFIKYKGVFCPCCGFRLRTRPHNKLSYAKFREKK